MLGTLFEKQWQIVNGDTVSLEGGEKDGLFCVVSILRTNLKRRNCHAKAFV